MARTDSELAFCFQRRARRAFLALLASLNAPDAAHAALRAQLSPEAVHEALTLAVLRSVVLSLGRARGLFGKPESIAHGRLFSPRARALDVQPVYAGTEVHWAFPEPLAGAEPAFSAELNAGLLLDRVVFADCPAELVGNLYELLLGESVRRSAGFFELSSGNKRKQTGTFFTPRALTEIVVARALEPLERRIRCSSHRAHDFVSDFRVCDPAVGGGAFLLETARALAARPGSQSALERRRKIVETVLYGVDVNPTAVAVAEAALCLFVADSTLALVDAGKNLRTGDALVGAPFGAPSAARTALLGRTRAPSGGLDFLQQFPEVFARGGFDLVVGNPPWVAYAGRAAQPLLPARKAYLGAHYSTLKGYPTLHGLFVERALRLAPQGTVALVVPSPIADLDGYRAVRRAVRAGHTPCEPMLEFGQDAFESVTQPCFALVAEATTGSSLPHDSDAAPFRLAERQRASGQAREVSPPAALIAIGELPAFPRELFGEMGFQSAGTVSKQLLLRAAEPDLRHHYPLLEGRDVRAFCEGEPRLFLAPDREALAKARCRLRELAEYQRVTFVIRQTARYPIAARHRGLPFRNSLLAGFEVDGLSADLVVGLLNSSLYRALHLASRRDARQAVFPQVKIAHLRALPAPPHHPGARTEIAALSAEMTQNGADPQRAARLDAAVFQLFSVESPAAREICEFLAARNAPR